MNLGESPLLTFRLAYARYSELPSRQDSKLSCPVEYPKRSHAFPLYRSSGFLRRIKSIFHQPCFPVVQIKWLFHRIEFVLAQPYSPFSNRSRVFNDDIHEHR